MEKWGLHRKSDIPLNEKIQTILKYYFSKINLNKIATIEFDRSIDFFDDAPSVGGEYNGLKWRDKNLLIIFPNGKMLPRLGRPLEREVLQKLICQI